MRDIQASLLIYIEEQHQLWRDRLYPNKWIDGLLQNFIIRTANAPKLLQSSANRSTNSVTHNISMLLGSANFCAYIFCGVVALKMVAPHLTPTTLYQSGLQISEHAKFHSNIHTSPIIQCTAGFCCKFVGLIHHPFGLQNWSGPEYLVAWC